MSEEHDRQALDVLREIREGQREMVALLTAQRALVEEQLRTYRDRVDESVSLQREAVRRQRSITLFAIPGILACVAAIAYLVFRYF
jgi:hypothetical protein